MLARDLHLPLSDLDGMTCAELRWWCDSLEQVNREQRRLYGGGR